MGIFKKVFGLGKEEKEETKETVRETAAPKNVSLDKRIFTRRALIFMCVIDNSSSMNGEKMKNANEACERAIREAGAFCEENNVDLYINIVQFNSDASYVKRMEKFDKNTFTWRPLQTQGATDMGKAFRKLCELDRSEIKETVRLVPPIAILISDGESNCSKADLEAGLDALKAHPLISKSIRIPVGIGPKDANGKYEFDADTLKKFGNQNLMMTAENPEDIVNAIVWTTMSASQMSVTPQNAGGQTLGEIFKKEQFAIGGSVGGAVTVPKAITDDIPESVQFI